MDTILDIMISRLNDIFGADKYYYSIPACRSTSEVHVYRFLPLTGSEERDIGGRMNGFCLAINDYIGVLFVHDRWITINIASLSVDAMVLYENARQMAFERGIEHESQIWV